ncbi:hypothetical protein ACFPU1_13240 [Thalassorhabdus alkalitolerans]|uniref:N-acetyltransferase domain-containing protein n=1 Tax=Thalassorhabdus alkalitolerans TaxID=2282697 RepID=A0ABW0YUN0_9BACI
MTRHNNGEMVTPGKEDINEMLELNYKIYPKEWHVSKEYVLSIMERNPFVYRVYKENKQVKGIHSLFPLPKTVYEQVLTGEISEKDLYEHIIDYKKPGDVYLYLISIIVDIHSQKAKEYTKHLLYDMVSQLHWIEKQDQNIKEIGAIAISKDGERILQRIGFSHSHSMKEEGISYPVFRSSKESILQAVTL